MRILPGHLPAACAIAGLALLWPVVGAHAQSQAGTVDFSVGEASVRSSTGVEQPAARGVAIAAGDTVETKSGRVQLRMIDGAYISLQPQSSLQVQAYSTGAEERGFLSLLRGGLRTITGLIGRQKRDSYRLTTTTGTLGIRGTEFAVTTGEGTRVNVTEGIVVLCTDAGCLDIGAGQSGFAPDNRTRPGLVFSPARLPPVAAPLAASFLVAETRNSAGVSVVAAEAIQSGGPPSGPPQLPPELPVTVPIPDGAGGFAVASVKAGVFSAGLLGGTLTSDSNGLVTQSVDCCFPGNTFSNGISSDFGADGLIAWGRWSSGLRGGVPVTMANYVAAPSITGVNPATTPSIVGIYTSFASTAPIITSGPTVATGTPNSVLGAMSVNFPNWTSGGGTLAYTLSIPVAGETFNVNGTAAQLGNGTSFLGLLSTITSTGSACASGCFGSIPFGNAIQGFITGTDASRAGANYGFTSTLGNVSGAVVFTGGPIQPP